jgi:hypothetical protein
MTIRPKAKTELFGSTAYTIVEVVLALAALGLLTITVVAGISTGLVAVQLAREDSRATQIMVEKVETIRLYNWDQIHTPGFIPSNFTAAYNPAGQGLVYTGTFSITPAAINASYSNDLLDITVRLNWTTGSIQRQRQMSTYFSRYGLQDYIY